MKREGWFVTKRLSLSNFFRYVCDKSTATGSYDVVILRHKFMGGTGRSVPQI
jgi:hypothetical protein